MRVSLLGIGVGLLVASGCVPMRVSSARQEQINDCLKQCPGSGGERKTPQLREDQWIDSRSTCERRCHDIAAGDWSPSGPAPTGSSADAGTPVVPAAP